MRASFAMIGILLSAAGASAYDADSAHTAKYLGTIVGSEKLCGLTFDPAALAAFVAQHIAADDIEFASNLQSETLELRVLDRDITSGEKIARCAQVKRNAEHFGFLKP